MNVREQRKGKKGWSLMLGVIGLMGCIVWATLACSVVSVCVAVGGTIASSVANGRAEDQAEEMQDLNEEAMADQKADAEGNRALKDGMQKANEEKMQAAIGSSITMNEIATNKLRIKAGLKKKKIGGMSHAKRAVRTPRPEHSNGNPAAA